MAIAPAGRCAHRDEDCIGAANGFLRIRREEETLFLHIAGHKIVEAWLIDRHDASLQLLDLTCILVDTGHRMAEVC